MDTNIPSPAGPLRLTAGCKVNLGLRITGRLENGYHTLRSIFLPLPRPFDTLSIREVSGQGVRVLTATPGIDPERNSVTKAWKTFADATGFAPSLEVTLEKGIPWGAGLGGGSSDAARLLRFLRSMPGAPAVTDEALNAMAARVGADVCFFLQDRPMLVTGIGDELRACSPSIPGTHLLLVTPPERVSTPWAYGVYDALSAEERAAPPDPANGPFVNDLELAVLPAFPGIARVKRALMDLGAAVAAMSGSGSSVYGIFRDGEAAERARAAMARDNQAWLTPLRP